jgi:hypothetical protein
MCVVCEMFGDCMYLFFNDWTTKRVRRMDPEVHQEMDMGINQSKMKMKTILTLPSQASHLLNHSQMPNFPIAYSFAFK